MINLLKEKYTTYKNRGFTLIELIVVMAVIAVLVLLAAPKFVGQTNTAQDRNIQNDVKVAEMKVSEALIDGLEVWESWSDDSVTSDTLIDLIGEDGTSLYGKGGPIYDMDDVEDGSYRILPGTFVEQEIRSRLEGAFYANQNGTVYYESGVVRQGEADKENGQEQGDADKKGPGYSDEGVDDNIVWNKYKLTEVVDVKTKDAIGEAYLLFNPVFIFENNLNLKPDTRYNVLLSGKTFDTEDQLVDKEYTFNNITSQNLLSDNQLLELAEQGGYRIIKKTNDPMELVMELIVDSKRESGLVGLFEVFKADKELFLDAYKDYDNIEELISSLFESFETKYGFTPEMGDITEAELLLFLTLTDSSITSNYFEGDYDEELWGEDLKSLTIDLFGRVPELDMGELFMFLSIIELSDYVGIGDTWAIDIGELSMFSPAYGESLDRIKIEELQAVGFVGGEEGDYPDSGEQNGFWYEKVN